MSKMLFADLLVVKDGLIKGPFGGDIKKSLFVPKGKDTLKVYEQGVVLKNDINHGTYYISKEHFESKLKRFEVKTGDLLMTGAGTLGELITVPENAPKGVINQALLRIRLNQNVISTTFFKYYFKYYIKAIISKINGDSVIPNLPPLPLIRNTEVDIPDTSYQNKISSVLSALDSKIELNNRINAELEAMAKTLYDYWFVQFDFPDKNGKPYKTSGGKMVWNGELNREVPEGWEIKLFADWINNDKSGDWGKEQIEGNYTEKVYCIRGADINGLNGLGELKSPERYILEKNLHKTLDPADLIVEISGGSPTQSTGRLAFITEETLARFDAPIICSNFCKAVTLKNKKQLYNFVYHWKSIYDAGVLFGYEGKTSGIKNLLFESFVSSHYTVVPEVSATNKFYDFMEQLESKKQKNLKENQKLTELRDWLLPMLMNGQVKVVA
jgi:type I restriction enzyme S subunit